MSEQALSDYYTNVYSVNCTPNTDFLASKLEIAYLCRCILAVSFPFQLFTFYCILTKTPNAMSSVKTSLLHLNFWYTLALIDYSAFSTPFFFNPYVGCTFVGVLTDVGVPQWFQNYLSNVANFGMMISITILFENRSSLIVHNAFRITKTSTRVIWISLNWIGCLICGASYYSHFPNEVETKLHVLKAQDVFKKCDPKCVFKDGTITYLNFKTFPNCTTVCAYLIIDDTSYLTMEQLTATFRNMKTLIGGLYIYDTSYKTAKFLTGLQRIECEERGIQILGNSNMIELGWKSLKTIIGTHLEIHNENLEKLNWENWKTFTCSKKDCSIFATVGKIEKFCVTPDEMDLLMMNEKAGHVEVSGKICAPQKGHKTQCAKPTVGCEVLVGNLNIGKKFDVKKVQSLRIIYGTLIVNGSTLTNLKCLGNLTHVVQLNDFKTAIYIQNNKKLKTVYLPKLKRVFNISWDRIIAHDLENNNPALMNDYKGCYAMRAALNDPDSSDGPSSCNSLKKPVKNKTTKKTTTKKTTTRKTTTKKTTTKKTIKKKATTQTPNEYFGYSDYPDYPTGTKYPKLSLAEFKKCDLKCVFTQVPLTTKNIDSFPKCAKVCAHIYIDDTSGLTEKKLSTTFKELKTLIGGLHIVVTNYKNLSFLEGLQKIESGYKTAIDVQNNNNLKTVRMPKLKLIVSDASMYTNRINFWNKTVALLTDYQSCSAIQSALVPEAYEFSIFSMYFDYWTCEQLEQFVKEGKKASAKNLSSFDIAGLGFNTHNPNFSKEKLNY